MDSQLRSRSRTSSDASSSSSFAPPPVSQRERRRSSSSSEQHQYNQAKRRRPTSPSRDSFSLSSSASSSSGALGRFVQFGILVLVLALVVPYVRSQFLSSASSRSPLTDKSIKNPHHPAPHLLSERHRQLQQQHEVDVDQIVGEEGDVFDFKHSDYVIKSIKADPATPEDEAIVPVSKVKDLPATKDLRSAKSKSNSSSSRSTRNSKVQQQRSKTQKKNSGKTRAAQDEDDEEEDNESEWQLNWSLGWILSLFRLGMRMVGFLSIPFRFLYRVGSSAVSKSYHGFRWGLSHTLRPIVIGLAPLTYLFAGLMYIFVQAPGRVLTNLAREFYPLYIFFGAASVMGIGMGLGAAAILYLTAFVFVDRVKPEHSGFDDLHQRRRSGSGDKPRIEPIDRPGKGMGGGGAKSKGKRRQNQPYNDHGDHHQRPDLSPGDQYNYGPIKQEYDPNWPISETPSSAASSTNQSTTPYSDERDLMEGAGTAEYDDERAMISPTSGFGGQGVGSSGTYFQYPAQQFRSLGGGSRGPFLPQQPTSGVRGVTTTMRRRF